MKQHILSISTALLAITGCGLDNYEEPQSHLTGNIIYNGQNIGLSHGKVTFNLYQDGYEKNGPITIYADQEGTYSALLFDGSYHLECIENNGPWLNEDKTIDIIVKGNTVADIEVTPYFIISDTAIALNGNEVKALCNVTRTAEGKNTRAMFLIIGPTPFLSDYSYSHISRKNQMPVSIGGNSISADISDIIDRYPTLYARLGLQINGIQECIYSEVIQIK
ncbi:MAG: DUF3823 domain-containing protein [Bacteroidales bacterium]|nr:DUF3823 domain-containing protein [Bacteroidales bacterium]